MDSLAYESEESRQQVMKVEGQPGVQYDDMSDEDASLFEIHDSDEDLEGVAPEACSAMSELQTPVLQDDRQLVNGISKSHRAQGEVREFSCEQTEKLLLNDDYFNEDKANSLGLLVKEGGKSGHIARKTCEKSSSWQTLHGAYTLTSEPMKNTCNRRGSLITYPGLKGRERLVEKVETNTGCTFRVPETKAFLQSHNLNTFLCPVGVDESERCNNEERHSVEIKQSCEAICSTSTYPCLRHTDPKEDMMQMEMKDVCHTSCVSVAELDNGSPGASEMPTEGRSKTYANSNSEKNLLSLLQEVRGENTPSVNWKPLVRGLEKVAACGKRHHYLESFTRDSFISNRLQPETLSRSSNGLCSLENSLACTQFEVGQIRITRSMSLAKQHPKKTVDFRIGECGLEGPVGKRTGKRSAPRGVRSVWGTSLGLISLAGGIDAVKPLASLQEKRAGKDNHGRIRLGPVWRRGKRKGKSHLLGKLRLHEEDYSQDMTNDSPDEKKNIKPTKRSNDSKIGHGSTAYQSTARPQKKSSKKMQSFANVNSTGVGKAGKRSNQLNKSISRKGQKNASTCRRSEALGADVPSRFSPNQVANAVVEMDGGSVEFLEFGSVGNRMFGEVAGFQKIPDSQTSKFQGLLQNGSLVPPEGRCIDADGIDGVGSSATIEGMTEVNLGAQIEEICNSQELISQEECKAITHIKSGIEADGRRAKEEEVLARLHDKSRSGNDESRCSQRDLRCSTVLSCGQVLEGQSGQDFLEAFESNKDVLTGKDCGNMVSIVGTGELNQNLLQTNQGVDSSCQSNYSRLPQPENLENMDEVSFRGILGEQGRKCAQVGEDAGSATTYCGVAKVAVNFVQQPEIKSQKRGRSSKKGIAKESAGLVSTGHLRTKNFVQGSSNVRKQKEPSRPGKTNSKGNKLSQGVVSLQASRQFKKTAARNQKRANKGNFKKTSLENTQKDKEFSMELCENIEFQIEHKSKRNSKSKSNGLVVGAAVTCELVKKAKEKREKFVGAEKTFSDVSKKRNSGCGKKRASQAPKTLVSCDGTRETGVVSTSVKKQLKGSYSTEKGKGNTSSRFTAKGVEEDTRSLKTNDVVVGTDIAYSVRVRTDYHNSVLHMEEQNSQGNTAPQESNPGEVQLILSESVLAETEGSWFTQMGERGTPVIAKQAQQEEISGCAAAIASGQNLELTTDLQKPPSCSSELIEGEILDQGINVRNNEYNTGSKAGYSGVGWVMCDDCRKWRCISTELADMIEATDARWTCSNNPNKEFADCSIPQEKSNAQINAELELSDDTVEEEDADIEDAVNSKSLDGVRGSRPATWTLTRHNIFLHRRRKTHDNDDSVICHCKPPEGGSQGCGDSCINRMVSVECVPEICPCGEACSNQQFRKRMYANVALDRFGKKGFGLKVLENVPKGAFITEYVGEVVDMHTFEARQKEYARTGQRHFYFMTLNSNEVIDAYAKGNLGRFINHSCEPNCQTEKWWVNGEICIGLFAIRDLLQGEEITFDYHYEPVYGAAAKKCHCGSSHCRGYIGGQPLDPNSIAESDSDDEEDPEPVMLEEASEEENAHLEDKTLITTKKFRQVSEAASWEPKMARLGRLKRKRSCGGTKAEDHDNALKHSSQLKRPKDSTNVRKNHGLKGLLSEANTGRQDWVRSSRSIQPSEVERKLNVLLDAQGGLMKKKDVAKHYIKLIVLSTASGEAIQGGPSWSVRDLSLLLDAVLKTSSRSVLSDILHKNGLQLLHNLVKQSRRNWKRIPILRKLMKVLELLSIKKVLTEQHITCMPCRPGLESFRDSIFELTWHDDTEVQHIARRFKSIWFQVGASSFRRSLREKNSKIQSQWSSFERLRSHQDGRFFSRNFSSHSLPDDLLSSQKLPLKSSQQPLSFSKGTDSVLQTERGSSVDMLDSAESEKLNCAVEGIEKSSSDIFPSALGVSKTPELSSLEHEPKRRKRVSRWDTPAQNGNAYPERQQLSEADNGPDHGLVRGLPGTINQGLCALPNSETGFNSSRQPFQQWIHFDPSPDCSDCPSGQQLAEKPPSWFEISARPPRVQVSGQSSVMRSVEMHVPPQAVSSSPSRLGLHNNSAQPGPHAMQAGAPQTQSFMGSMLPQQFYQPTMPVCPFPGSNSFLVASCGQPNVQHSGSPSSVPMPFMPQVGQMQVPNVAYPASCSVPRRVDCRMSQKTPAGGPRQLPYGRAFQPAPPGFIPCFENQGEFQRLKEPSGNVRPHNACHPVHLPERFQRQGLPSFSAKKLPMGHPEPLAAGLSRSSISDHRDKEADACRESLGEFEPEPPVPGL